MIEIKCDEIYLWESKPRPNTSCIFTGHRRDVYCHYEVSISIVSMNCHPINYRVTSF